MTRLSEMLAGADGSELGAAATFSDMKIQLPERVQIHDGGLEWSEGVVVADMRFGRLNGACLRHFIRLADAPETKIASFARTYGPLTLGEDGYPVDQDDLPSRIDEEEPPAIGPTLPGSDEPLITRRVWYREPLAAWRAWARYVGTVFLLSHELRAGKLAVPDVRLKRLGLDPGPNDPNFEHDSPYIERDATGTCQLSALGRTVYDRLWPWRLCRDLEACHTAEEQWALLARDVSLRLLGGLPYEIRLAGTAQHPRVELGQTLFEQMFGYRRIYSALPIIAGQLVAAISGGRGTQLCADCRIPYPVQRHRKNGRCPECRRRAHSAAVQRSKKKRREREATLLHDEQASTDADPRKP
jgi:hypothetical protein